MAQKIDENSSPPRVDDRRPVNKAVEPKDAGKEPKRRGTSAVALPGSEGAEKKRPRKKARKNRQPKQETREPAGRQMKVVGSLFIGIAAAVSAGLNGYANARYAGEGYESVAAWGMGMLTPVLVVLGMKLAALSYNKDRNKLALAMGGTESFLLALSVTHCSQSISVLTGSPIFQAVAYAVGIDVGIVVCEITMIIDSKDTPQ